MVLGQCHLCGRTLAVHAHFRADGYQHEEYYCDGCGEYSRGMIRLRFDDPAWWAVYERRQSLIEQGPGRAIFRRGRRHRARILEDRAAEISRLTRELLEDDHADEPEEAR
jgi:hypothetical protein